MQALCSGQRQVRANAALYAVPAVLDVAPQGLSVLLAALLRGDNASTHKV